MKIDYHLCRHPDAAPVAALLLLTHDTSALVRLLSGLGCDPLPPVYKVADGFLLKLERPTPNVIGGVLRLRALADNLYLPVDAELVPPLLPEEAKDFGRLRGIVFLPHGRALEFDPARPLPLSALVSTDKVRRDPWEPLPEPEPLADQLTEITLEQPENISDDLIVFGNEDIGSEAPELDDASLPSKALGSAAFSMGKFLTQLGKMLGLKGLSAAGMKWMAAGLGMAPGLAASVMGRQEAMLRALLRAFREGKTEQALRRALPLNDDSRGSTPASGAQLPVNNLNYSLPNILGGSSGPAGAWFTDYNLYEELRREYRRQAELATERGDFRRAAFIHAKLLNDYRAAAAVLSAGGLHRDAAILYLKRLADPLGAAREFEAAGETDRALEIYRRRSEHLLAGDLLRRLGEEEEAQAEYRLAADQIVESGRGYYEAGELLRTRAKLNAIANEYYKAGWAKRPAGSPVPCALRLAQGFASEGTGAKLLALAREGDEFLAGPGNDLLAADFYNEIASLAGKVPQHSVQDDLLDLALMGIGGKLRQRAASGLVSTTPAATMFGASHAWPPPVVSDAQFALRRAAKVPRSTAITGFTTVHLRARIQLVTAVCQAAVSGEIYVGFESGEVVCFQPGSGELVTVCDERSSILALGAPDRGGLVVSLIKLRDDATLLRSVDHNYVGAGTSGLTLKEMGESEFCHGMLGGNGQFLLATMTGPGIEFFKGPPLVPIGHRILPQELGEPHAALLVRSPLPMGVALLGLYDHKLVFWHSPVHDASSVAHGGGWRPKVPDGSSLSRPVLSRLDKTPDAVEIVGIGAEGCIYHTDVQLADGKFAFSLTKAASGKLPFLAAALVRSGLVAAVTRSGAQWLRRTPAGLAAIGHIEAALPSAIACFPHHRGKELIVVCADGTIIRLPAACF